MGFSRNAKDCTIVKRIPDIKIVTWTVEIRRFSLPKLFWWLKFPPIPFSRNLRLINIKPFLG